MRGDLTFLILGASSGGLFLARQLRKQWPQAKIVAFGNAIHDIGRFSNTIDVFVPVSNSEGLYVSLCNVIREYSGLKIRAYMCSNPMLEWVVLEHPDLFEILEFENPISVYRKFVDKNALDQFCSELCIPVPQEYSVTDSALWGKLPYPLALKPSTKMVSVGVSKFRVVDSSEQMKDYCSQVESMGIDLSHIVCQKYVSGDNRYEYGYGGFFVNGIPLIDICFYQFRQQPQGLCCYTREMSDEELSNRVRMLVAPLLSTTRINGFIEFDIKQDASSGCLYLLDVNPRPWRSSEMLLGKLGKNSNIFNPIIRKGLVVWRYPYREMLSIKNGANVSYSDCYKISSCKKRNYVVSLFDCHDLKPFLNLMRNDCVGFVKLIMGR